MFDLILWAVIGIAVFYAGRALYRKVLETDIVEERKARALADYLNDKKIEEDGGLATFIGAIGSIREGMPAELGKSLLFASIETFQKEGFGSVEPPAKMNSIEGARYLDSINARPDPAAAGETFRTVLANIAAVIPPARKGFKLEAKFIDVIQPAALEGIILPLYKDKTLPKLREQILRNVYSVSGVSYDATHFGNAKLILPRDYKGSQPLDYVRHTVFEKALATPMPQYVPDDQHTLILGGTGSGKTSLIQQLILHYLKEDVSLIVVDSQTDLIRKILNMKLEKDPILLTPRDQPSINLFHVPDRGDPEQIANSIIDVYMFFFDHVLGADLTSKQGIFFKFVARLLLALPKSMGRNATILDMFELMDNPGFYQDAIDSLPPIQRNFFETDFKLHTFKQTKEQVRYRLQGLLENPSIAQLFTSHVNRVDLFKELNQGSLVLIDTAKEFLKSNSVTYGRFFISQILRAIMERAVIPEDRRKRTVLIVDEASEYLNADMTDLLTQVRKYNMTCIFAMQLLEQATPAFRATMLTNMTTKYAGGVSASDARSLSADMRTTPDFILSQPKLTFAVHSRGMSQPFAAKVTPGALDSYPKRTDFEEFLERNRTRVRAPLSLPYYNDPPQPEERADPATPPRAPKPLSSPRQDPDAPTDEW